MFSANENKKLLSGTLFDLYARIKQGQETLDDYQRLEGILVDLGLNKDRMQERLRMLGFRGWEDLYGKRRDPSMNFETRLRIEGDQIGLLLSYIKIALQDLGSELVTGLDSIPSEPPYQKNTMTTTTTITGSTTTTTTTKR